MSPSPAPPPDVDLDNRLARLAEPAPDPAELRRRAATIRTRAARRRTRRRGIVGLAAASVVVVAVLAAAALVGRDDRSGLTTGPATTPSPTDATTPPTAPPTTSTSRPPTTLLNTAPGLALTVTPAAGLRDGEPVHVHVEGLDQLSNPQIIQCAGDLTVERVTRRCDLRPLEVVGGTAGGPVQPDQVVAVRRTISTSDGETTTRYDCATEAAGCVLAVGEMTLPVRGAAVPIRFDPVALPTPRVSVRPATALADRQPVTVHASGLSPNLTYRIQQCSVGPEPACEELTWPTARADRKGRLTTEVPALAALYGWRGRVDCTVTRCEVVVADDTGVRFGAGPVAFAPGVQARVPRLSIDPPGPYRDGQVVTVRGTGFPPGIDIGDQIGQCPVGKDTAVEERCGRSTLSEVLVDDDGTFTMTYELHDSLLFTGSCRTAPGCQLGWVIVHGPTMAPVPLEFAP